MNKISIALIVTLLAGTLANAQIKVANYSFGKSETDTYEQLSFWVKDGKRQAITYTYGMDRKEVNVRYVGKEKLSNTSGFMVQSPTNTTLTIVPAGATLTVRNPKANYSKKFTWEYEGPVNGIGTFCNVCAQDEKEAMKIIKESYL